MRKLAFIVCAVAAIGLAAPVMAHPGGRGGGGTGGVFPGGGSTGGVFPGRGATGGRFPVN